MNDNNEAARPHLAISAIISLSQALNDVEALRTDEAAAVRAICLDAIPQLAELYSAGASLDQVVSCASRACVAITDVLGRRLARLDAAA